MNYPFPTRHDTQSTREISYAFENTNCISQVSWYVYSIKVNGNRGFCTDSQSQMDWEVSRHLRRNCPEFTVTDCGSNKTWGVHPIEVNSGRDNSELISEASGPRDASVTKSIEVYFNRFKKNSKVTNRSVNQIWEVVIQLSQLTITVTIPEPMCL